MKVGQLYLVEVQWSRQDVIENILPSRYAIHTTLASDNVSYEASIPAYSRSQGRDVQLAIRSKGPCFIIKSNDEPIMLTKYVDPDTGVHWWIEKGRWKRSCGGYHDAPSFRHPGGQILIQIADVLCTVHMYYPGISDIEFTYLLDDFKNWCWGMATDENCYVTVGQQSEVKVLSPSFLNYVSGFLRYVNSILDLPQRELRETVAEQKIHHLRPNLASLRFLAQKGEQPMVPGRSSEAYYNTKENRFVRGMLKMVIQMLRPQERWAQYGVQKLRMTAALHDELSQDLLNKKVEVIDSDILDMNIRNVQSKLNEINDLFGKGCQEIQIKNERGKYLTSDFTGYYKGKWAVVSLSCGDYTPKIIKYIERYRYVRLIGEISATLKKGKNEKEYYKCTINSCKFLDVFRDYDKEYTSLATRRKHLERKNWERTIPADILNDRKKEAAALKVRAKLMLDTAVQLEHNGFEIDFLLKKAYSFDKRATALGISTDIRFLPSMVFLQSPAYYGALSAYRQLIEMTGLDKDILDDLFLLEEVGIRDWPAVYERWCLCALLRVLEDEFNFNFNKGNVRNTLLKYCVGAKPGRFVIPAIQADMDISLILSYQLKLPNGRIPDFMLEFTDNKSKKCSSAVLDAKSCSFIKKSGNVNKNIFLYLDDCLQELLEDKNYHQDGDNIVFVMHPSKEQCITQPTTNQPWAKSSSYGGDFVFKWEDKLRLEHTYGAVLVTPLDLSNLKRLILLMIQYKLGRMDICPSCGASGENNIKVSEGKGVGSYYTCNKCSFLSVDSFCFKCKNRIVKNREWWTFHDLHPTDVWNIKCPSCGALL